MIGMHLLGNARGSACLQHVRAAHLRPRCAPVDRSLQTQTSLTECYCVYSCLRALSARCAHRAQHELAGDGSSKACRMGCSTASSVEARLKDRSASVAGCPAVRRLRCALVVVVCRALRENATFRASPFAHQATRCKPECMVASHESAALGCLHRRGRLWTRRGARVLRLSTYTPAAAHARSDSQLAHARPAPDWHPFGSQALARRWCEHYTGDCGSTGVQQVATTSCAQPYKRLLASGRVAPPCKTATKRSQAQVRHCSVNTRARSQSGRVATGNASSLG